MTTYWQGIYVVHLEPGERNYCKCGKTKDLDSVYRRYGIMGKVNAHLEPVVDPDYAESLIFLLLFPFRKFDGERGLETLNIQPLVAIDIVKWVCNRTNKYGREIKNLQMTRVHKQASKNFTNFKNSYTTVNQNIKSSLINDLTQYWSQSRDTYLNVILSRINSWEQHCIQHFLKTFDLGVGTFNISVIVDWYKKYQSTTDHQMVIPFEDICTILAKQKHVQIKLG